MPDSISVQTPRDGTVVWGRAPFDPEVTQALVRAARTIRRDEPPSRIKPHHSVYVVLLEFRAGDFGLYVGSTGISPEERFLKHKAGHKDSPRVRRFGVGLLPTLYKHLNPQSWESAVAAEKALADALRTTGIQVRQA